MKTLFVILVLSLLIFAGNMSLGPFNKPGFVPQEEQLRKKQEEGELKKKRLKEDLEVLHKRQALIIVEEKAKQEKQKKQLEQEKRAVQKKEKERLKQAQILQQKQINSKLEEKLLAADPVEEKTKNLPEEQPQAESLDVQVEEEPKFGPIITLIPVQQDLNLNNPDDIRTELVNTTRLRYILLNAADTPENIKEYIRFLNTLSSEYNLDFAFSYTGVAQTESQSSTSGAGGKYDMVMSYTPVDYSTQVALKIEGLHQVGSNSSIDFRNEIGSLSSTSAPYATTSLFLSELWIQHSFSKFIVRAGKIDATSFFDSHLYKSNSRFFFNSAFSNNPYNGYPPLGLGVAARYVEDSYYFSTEVVDANAVEDKIDDTFFSESNYYTAFEFGLTPEDGSKYHISTWHKDKANIVNTQEARGVIASVAQALGENTHIILRAALSDNATAKRHASVGLGKTSLFDEHDIFGLAIGTLVPSREGYRSQTAIETFYRVDPLPSVQISGDLQLIYHPSRGGQVWALLPGIRLRLLF